jgi:hypothetical protein
MIEVWLWTQKQDIGPSPRAIQGMTYDSQNEKTLLFGGLQSVPNVLLSDTWEWDGNFWTQRQDMGPPKRGHHSMIYDKQRERIVLFGGVGQSVFLYDTWELKVDISRTMNDYVILFNFIIVIICKWAERDKSGILDGSTLYFPTFHTFNIMV